MATISEQIKVLCIRSNISVAELARRLGKSPQSFNAKLKRESFGFLTLGNLKSGEKRSLSTKEVKQLYNMYPNVMTETEINAVYDKLYSLTPVSSDVKQKHIESIQEKHTFKEQKITEFCPRCGEKLVLRTTKKGENKGNQFWGCSSYPKCRYMKKL